MNVELDPPYDHYASELALLYLIRLGIEELRSLLVGFARPPVVRLSAMEALMGDLRAADLSSQHLWFLGTEPHAFDRVMAANDLMFKRAGGRSAAILKEPRPDPAALSQGEIGFDPNPLRRLIDRHRDLTELTTGLSYRSPYPRADAQYR